MELEIIQPDDFHHHLRDGDALPSVVQHAERYFSRVIAMPNLKPPVRTLADARAYHDRIRSHSQGKLTPLMTLYLTDETTPEEVQEAQESGLVYGVKYYPAGATTNSQMGVTHVDKVHKVLEVREGRRCSYRCMCLQCNAYIIHIQIFISYVHYVIHIHTHTYTQCMQAIQLPLLIHGEVTDPSTDIFDRESLFIDTILHPIILTRYPHLHVILEHITTIHAVEYVMNSPYPNLAATITPHHLAYNRNALFQHGVCVHKFCLPILKREEHRRALVMAATSGSHKFFLGT
ncbi:dihydroorotase [archaeon]|nr:MAG: dihydroorotase [archaeon]